MSKEMWIEAHNRAVEEAMDADPNLSWDDAYNADSTADRANEICRDRLACMIDAARDRAKYAALNALSPAGKNSDKNGGGQ